VPVGLGNSSSSSTYIEQFSEADAGSVMLVMCDRWAQQGGLLRMLCTFTRHAVVPQK
jgi:hypothetical protein